MLLNWLHDVYEILTIGLEGANSYGGCCMHDRIDTLHSFIERSFLFQIQVSDAHQRTGEDLL